MIAHDLATEPNARQLPRGQHILLSDSHLLRLAAYELDTARRAPRIPAASVQLVDARILHKRQNQSLALWHFKLADALDR
jgi:hypothetical protein